MERCDYKLCITGKIRQAEDDVDDDDAKSDSRYRDPGFLIGSAANAGVQLGDAIRVSFSSPKEEQPESSLPRTSDSERLFAEGLRCPRTAQSRWRTDQELSRLNSQLDQGFYPSKSRNKVILTSRIYKEKQMLPDGDASGALKG